MEKALLVHVRLTDRGYRDSWPPAQAAQELRNLAESGGLQVVEEMRIPRDRPTPNYFIGKGKVEELQRVCQTFHPDVVVFGEDLHFIQQRNLQQVMEVKVIDRTQLILDIFAQRARSQEGKIQIELAQLEYLLPRLTGMGASLSRLGGGIGTRGPGEQKLEMDRRRIRDRIGRLGRQLASLKHRRSVARHRRSREEIPLVALVGYTNVGKSTLLNALTQAGTISKDQLFTTLDPLTRRFRVGKGLVVLLADTVGFLHRLPHHLIEAFRATLEEVVDSQLIVHVADASSPMLAEMIGAVEEVLHELQADGKPVLLVLNKCDRLAQDQREGLRQHFPEAVLMSAARGDGLAEFADRLCGILRRGLIEVNVRVRPEEMAWVNRLYKEGQVLKRRAAGSDLLLKVRIPTPLRGQLDKAGLLVGP